jgi:hypothetical protein
MTHVLLINVALFLPVVAAGVVAAWYGWNLAGRDATDGAGGAGGSGVSEPPPTGSDWPSPVSPRGGASRDDLARSA